ncbi:MAG: hypothetical protein M5R40_11600 [Anaerolineae bacterium]|nr:hypothetical protein [Anaerolineae bacterium]
MPTRRPALLLYLLARRLLGNRAPALALGLLWAVAPFSVTVAIGGMETSVFILWMVATFWLYVSGRDHWAGLTAALGVLTRTPGRAGWQAGLLHQLWARFRARPPPPARLAPPGARGWFSGWRCCPGWSSRSHTSARRCHDPRARRS